MGDTHDTRLRDLERTNPRQARGPGFIWVDGTEVGCSDEMDENGYPPRMWATRAAAEAWWKEHEKTLDVLPEGEISVVWLDMNQGKTPAEISAGLQEDIARAADHEERKRKWRARHDGQEKLYRNGGS